MIALKGNFPDPLLSGNMLILDGKYTKDFKILDAMGGKTEPARTIEPDSAAFKPKAQS